MKYSLCNALSFLSVWTVLPHFQMYKPLAAVNIFTFNYIKWISNTGGVLIWYTRILIMIIMESISFFVFELFCNFSCCLLCEWCARPSKINWTLINVNFQNLFVYFCSWKIRNSWDKCYADFLYYGFNKQYFNYLPT